MAHILSALVENKPGVLSRITGLFSRRGFNITSLNVAPTEDDNYSRITAVIDAEDVAFEQIMKQLFKLINVAKISHFENNECIQHELMFIKVNAPEDKRTLITETAALLGAKVIDVGKSILTFECCGEPTKLEDLISLLQPYGIVEITRTGSVAVSRSAK